MNIRDKNSASTSDLEDKGKCTSPSRCRQCYEIRFKGHLDNHWAAWFHGCALTLEADGTSTMVAQVVDQAELFGLLSKVRDLSLFLISVNKIESDVNVGHQKESKQ